MSYLKELDKVMEHNCQNLIRRMTGTIERIEEFGGVDIYYPNKNSVEPIDMLNALKDGYAFCVSGPMISRFFYHFGEINIKVPDVYLFKSRDNIFVVAEFVVYSDVDDREDWKNVVCEYENKKK